jgi:hypothetical protein
MRRPVLFLCWWMTLAFGPRRGGGMRLALSRKLFGDNFIQSVVDLRRGIDVLLARADVNPNRIAYVGSKISGFGVEEMKPKVIVYNSKH